METGTHKYFASAGDDQVITTAPAVLLRILVGKDVGSGQIEVSNDVAIGDANIILHYESGTLLADTSGVIEVGVFFSKGISADLTNQTNVTFVYRTEGHTN